MATFITFISLLAILYIVPQIIFKYSQTIQGFLLFMNQLDTDHDFNQPLKFGLRCVRSLRLKHHHSHADGQLSSSSIELGVWHILPGTRAHNCPDDHLNINQTNNIVLNDQNAFADNRPIVLYVHGNKGTRAGDYRSRLYKRLAYEYDFHVVTFDYRGFGDSSKLKPSAEGLILDTEYMYQWLLAQSNVDRNRVFVWGHSLGTGVAVRMLARMPESSRPKGLVLEAPFDSIANAIKNHPFSRPFRLIPMLFEHFIINPIETSHDLNSLDHVLNIKSTPMLILHAEDDPVIPIELGQNLYQNALKVLGEERVDMIKISAKYSLGHKYICDHSETMVRVRMFIGGGSDEL